MTKNQTYDDLKTAAKHFTALEKLLTPKVTLAQHVAFAILCVRQINAQPEFILWSDKWLSGEDRSVESAGHMAKTAWAEPARMAASAADSAAKGRAVRAEYESACAADMVVWRISNTGISIDFAALAQEAMKY